MTRPCNVISAKLETVNCKHNEDEFPTSNDRCIYDVKGDSKDIDELGEAVYITDPSTGDNMTDNVTTIEEAHKEYETNLYTED